MSLKSRLSRLERTIESETFNDWCTRMRRVYGSEAIDSFVFEIERRPNEHLEFFADHGYWPDWGNSCVLEVANFGAGESTVEAPTNGREC